MEGFALVGGIYLVWTIVFVPFLDRIIENQNRIDRENARRDARLDERP